MKSMLAGSFLYLGLSFSIFTLNHLCCGLLHEEKSGLPRNSQQNVQSISELLFTMASNAEKDSRTTASEDTSILHASEDKASMLNVHHLREDAGLNCLSGSLLSLAASLAFQYMEDDPILSESPHQLESNASPSENTKKLHKFQTNERHRRAASTSDASTEPSHTQGVFTDERTRTQYDSGEENLENLGHLSPSLKTGGCLVNLATSRFALRNGDVWAQKMADSSAHMGAGLMDKALDLSGIRSECLEAQVPAGLGFQPQYCIVMFEINQVKFPEALKPQQLTGMSAGVCMPSTCHNDDIIMVVGEVVKGQIEVKGLNISRVVCRRQETSGPNAAASGMIAFLALWGLALTSATCLDCWCRRAEQHQHQDQHQDAGEPRPASSSRDESLPPGQTPQQQAARPENFSVSFTEASVHLEEMETDIDSDQLSTSSTQPLTKRSVTRLPLGKRRRQIRGILRGKLEKSLLTSAEDAEKRQLSNLCKLARCFSLKTSLGKLLDTSVSDAELRCLHGIRALSLAWVVLVNTMMYQVFFTRNAFRLFQDWRSYSFRFALLGNGFLSLDSLFALSGLLVGYAYSTELDRSRGKMNWLRFVFQRYWRIVPTLLVVGAAYLALFPYLTDGPLALEQAPDEATCLKWGWMSVLLLQNFSPSTATCMSWTWFLAVDFQLFLLTPLLLWMLYHRPWVAYAFVFVVVLVSSIVSGVLTRSYGLSLTLFTPPDLDNLDDAFDPDLYASLYFFKPWAHAGAFYPPLLVGFLLYRSSRRASFRTRTVVLCWGSAVIAALVVLFSVRKELVGLRAFSSSARAFYNAVHRCVWGLCVSWTVLACATGYGGPVNSLLSWSGWKPVSRLALAVYLVHPVVAQASHACLERLLYVTNVVAVYQFLGVLLCSLLLAVVVTVAFEMPLTALPHWVASCCTNAVKD